MVVHVVIIWVTRYMQFVLVIIVSLQLKSATHESSCAMTLNCIASNFTSCFIASSTPDLNHCKCLLTVTAYTIVCNIYFCSIS